MDTFPVSVQDLLPIAAILTFRTSEFACLLSFIGLRHGQKIGVACAHVIPSVKHDIVQGKNVTFIIFFVVAVLDRSP